VLRVDDHLSLADGQQVFRDLFLLVADPDPSPSTSRSRNNWIGIPFATCR
jgi:hypothetical protein